MKYIQLGNGGGLDILMTNSSFLIEVKKDEYLLFDCGFNILQRLIEIQNNSSNEFHISQIRHVFISHTHEDHAGNLESLMFWNYFKNDIKMSFYCANTDTKDYMLNRLKCNLYNGGRIQEARLFKYIELLNFHNKEITKNITIRPLQYTYHGDTESNGLVILDKRYGALVITGDTKASSMLQNEILDYTTDLRTKIFHDKSNWNAPSKNVHACDSDIESEYTEKFRNSLTFYHTGTEDYCKDWQEI